MGGGSMKSKFMRSLMPNDLSISTTLPANPTQPGISGDMTMYPPAEMHHTQQATNFSFGSLTFIFSC